MPRPATGLNTVTRKLPDGRIETYWYYRATGLLIGRSSQGWTKEQAKQRAAEMASEAPRAGPPTGSFGQLCELYLASPAFKKRRPRTQTEYRDHINLMRTDLGWEAVPVGGITRTVVRTLHARYEDRPWRGNAIIRTLRRVINFGIDDLEMPGLVKNPAAKIELFETLPRDQIWHQHHIDAFLDAVPADQPELRLGIALLLFTVQRPSDTLAMEKPDTFERDGRTWIRLRQAKTDELLDVPCHHRLAEEMGRGEAIISARVEAWAARARRRLQSGGEGAPLLGRSQRGKKWTYRNFAKAWDRIRRRANWRIARAAIRAMGGLPARSRKAEREIAKRALLERMLHDLQRRDLRRTGIVRLAIAGATVPQIAALSGHSIDVVSRIIETYLPRRGEVALAGMEKWESTEGAVVALSARRLKTQ